MFMIPDTWQEDIQDAYRKSGMGLREVESALKDRLGKRPGTGYGTIYALLTGGRASPRVDVLVTLMQIFDDKWRQLGNPEVFNTSPEITPGEIRCPCGRCYRISVIPLEE